MSKRIRAAGEGSRVEREASGYCSNFKQQDVTAAARFVRLSWPDMSSPQIAADLDNRITASNVRQWRTGKRHIPPWVIEEMRNRAGAALEAIGQIKTGPGKRAGWNNLGAWRAAQNS